MSDPIQEDEDLAVDAESLGGEVSFDVAEDERGRRLDALVSERVATARAQVRRWIDDGLGDKMPARRFRCPVPTVPAYAVISMQAWRSSLVNTTRSVHT